MNFQSRKRTLASVFSSLKVEQSVTQESEKRMSTAGGTRREGSSASSSSRSTRKSAQSSVLAVVRSLGCETERQESDLTGRNYIPAMVEILAWLTSKIAPEAGVEAEARSASTAEQRVGVARKCALLVMRETGVRVSVRELFEGEVASLLKVAAHLRRAELQCQHVLSDRPRPRRAGTLLAGRAAIGLEVGVRLHSLLKKEHRALRRKRDRVSAFLDEWAYNVESEEWREAIEASIDEQLSALRDEMAVMREAIDEESAEHAKMRTRLSRVNAECERYSLKLERMKPQRVSEEKECAVVHRQWLHKYMSVCYLQRELAHMTAAEQMRRHKEQEYLARVQERMRAGEMHWVTQGEPDRAHAPSSHSSLSSAASTLSSSQ